MWTVHYIWFSLYHFILSQYIPFHYCPLKMDSSVYKKEKLCYHKSHGCLFGSRVPNLQSQCHSTAPSDYEQVNSKIHPLRLHFCH